MKFRLLNNNLVIEFKLRDLASNVESHVGWVQVHIHEGCVQELRDHKLEYDLQLVRSVINLEVILALVALPYLAILSVNTGCLFL